MKIKSLVAQFKVFILLIIDAVAAFCALSLMVWLRYGSQEFEFELKQHLVPFFLVFLVFVFAFYIFNLYSFRFNKEITEFTASFIKSVLVSLFLSVFAFYLFENLLKITPKTNLFIFTGIFSLADFYLRILAKRYFIKNKINRKIVLIMEEEDKIFKELKKGEEIWYEIINTSKNLNADEVLNYRPDLIAIGNNIKADMSDVYKLIKNGILVYTINKFYEEMFLKVPAEHIAGTEIVGYISKNRPAYNFTKRVLDCILAIILLIIFFPIFIIIGVLVKITSPGPILFKQKRVGLNDDRFTVYKFRSMFVDAEKDGPVWTKDSKKDPRVSSIGRFLRQTHLDELPQLWNILLGDISFVGPRPERPEFVEKLKKEVSFYDLRHSVKAGLTGWAQINYPYGASIEDSKEKLKYDMYYIKNRSIFFDILIIMKTVAKIFSY